MANLVISNIGGNCPVQAEGTVDGVPFYFRARGQHWAIYIGSDALSLGHLAWHYTEPYQPENQFAAGWMEEDEARAFIDKAVALWEQRDA